MTTYVLNPTSQRVHTRFCAHGPGRGRGVYDNLPDSVIPLLPASCFCLTCCRHLVTLAVDRAAADSTQ